MRGRHARLVSVLLLGCLLAAGYQGLGSITAPGVIPASGCATGGVFSTDEFTSTGFSQVRTVGPNAEATAGAWVIADDAIPSTGVLGSPNCPPGGNDTNPLFVVALKVTPTIGSWQSADIQEIQFIRDSNLNGQYDPGLDLVFQSRSGSQLQSEQSITFFNGPQAPLTVVPDGGSFGLLAVVKIGPNPTSGSQFGLQLEAMAADVPGNAPPNNVSSSFSNSRNPAGSSIRLQIVGGSSGGGNTPPPGGGSGSGSTPISHISNGSGNVESDIQVLDFGGTLKSRFREDPIRPGTREAIAMAVAICDGGTLGNSNATILVPVAGAAPRIAGGLASIPCIVSPGADGLVTGFNGGVLAFRGSLAQYMGTVRIYADTNFNGQFFDPSELVAQMTPQYNAGTGEALVQFGRQGQIMTANNGAPVADGPNPIPLVLIITVDINNGAPSGTVDALLGLGVGDDTAQGAGGICAVRLGANCGSNLMGSGPARDSIQVVAQGSGGSTPPPGAGGSYAAELRSYDSNSNDLLETSEFLSVIDAWIARQISDGAFFASIDLWIDQRPISSASVGTPTVQTRMTNQGVRFSVPQAASLSVEVFGLDGRSVFREATGGATLAWNLRSRGGAPVANGVYLYRTSMTTHDGRTIHSDVRKLVVSQ